MSETPGETPQQQQSKLGTPEFKIEEATPEEREELARQKNNGRLSFLEKMMEPSEKQFLADFIMHIAEKQEQGEKVDIIESMRAWMIERSGWKKLFIRELSFTTKADALKETYAPFGEMADVAVVTDKNTHKSRGFGFVTYKDTASAMKALEQPYKIIENRVTQANIAIPIELAEPRKGKPGDRRDDRRRTDDRREQRDRSRDRRSRSRSRSRDRDRRRRGRDESEREFRGRDDRNDRERDRHEVGSRSEFIAHDPRPSSRYPDPYSSSRSTAPPVYPPSSSSSSYPFNPATYAQLSQYMSSFQGQNQQSSYPPNMPPQPPSSSSSNNLPANPLYPPMYQPGYPMNSMDPRLSSQSSSSSSSSSVPPASSSSSSFNYDSYRPR